MRARTLTGQVIVVGGADRAPGGVCVAELSALGAKVVGWRESGAAAANGVAEAMDRYGRIDAVVAAGLDNSPDCIGTYLLGTIALVEAALEVMDPARAGRIVGIGSGAGAFGSARSPRHAAAAAGVIGYIRSVALALRDTCIRANVVSVAMMSSVMPGCRESRFIVPAVAYLCHADCRVNGEVWSAGQGRFATIFSGTVPGHFEPESDIDDIAAHLEEIRGRDHAVYPRRGEDEGLLVEV